MYAGTGALESGSAIEDAKRSISRTIKNNTSDKDKQHTIDRLIYGTLPHTLQGQNNLALIGPRATSLSDEICKNVAFRQAELAVEIPLRVACCTWNVNGGTRSRQINVKLGEDRLGDWLLGRVTRMRAIAPFPAGEEGDLELIEGELVEIVERVDEAWMKGKKDTGECGIFPSNFVEPIDDQYIATFDYASDEPLDLSFAAGETITVTSKGTNPLINYTDD